VSRNYKHKQIKVLQQNQLWFTAAELFTGKTDSQSYLVSQAQRPKTHYKVWISWGGGEDQRPLGTLHKLRSTGN